MRLSRFNPPRPMIRGCLECPSDDDRPIRNGQARSVITDTVYESNAIKHFTYQSPVRPEG